MFIMSSLLNDLTLQNKRGKNPKIKLNVTFLQKIRYDQFVKTTT